MTKENRHHEHTHAAIPLLPPDPALRVQGHRDIALSKRGFVDPAAVDALVDVVLERRSARRTAAQVCRPFVGAIGSIGARSRRMRTRRRLRSFGFSGQCRASIWSPVETPADTHNVVVLHPVFPATRGRCWACRGLVQVAPSIAPVVVRGRALFSMSLRVRLPEDVERCASGIRRRKSGIWSFRSGPVRGLRPERRLELAALVTRDSMNRTGLHAPEAD